MSYSERGIGIVRIPVTVKVSPVRVRIEPRNNLASSPINSTTILVFIPKSHKFYHYY